LFSPIIKLKGVISRLIERKNKSHQGFKDKGDRLKYKVERSY